MTVKQMERTAKARIKDYELSSDTELSDCYKSYSIFKQRAYNHCYECMIRDGGTRFRIISHNVNVFTCGYIYADNETGVLKFRYFSPTFSISVDY